MGLTLYSRVLGSPNHQFWDPMTLREASTKKHWNPSFGRWFLTPKKTAGGLVPDGILQSLRDCIGRKAVSTSAKHVATYHSFAHWETTSMELAAPMTPKEVDIYDYVKRQEKVGWALHLPTAFLSRLVSWRVLREPQHTPGAYPRHPQTPKWKEFLHKLLVGGLGYAPGVCWKVLRRVFQVPQHAVIDFCLDTSIGSCKSDGCNEEVAEASTTSPLKSRRKSFSLFPKREEWNSFFPACVLPKIQVKVDFFVVGCLPR